MMSEDQAQPVFPRAGQYLRQAGSDDVLELVRVQPKVFSTVWACRLMAVCWNRDTSREPSRYEFSVPINPWDSFARTIFPLSMMFAKSSLLTGCDTM